MITDLLIETMERNPPWEKYLHGDVASFGPCIAGFKRVFSQDLAHYPPSPSGTGMTSVRENRPLCHLRSVATVYGSSSLVNLPRCTNVKTVSWCFCPSCVTRSFVCFSLSPLFKLEPLTVSVFTILLQFYQREWFLLSKCYGFSFTVTVRCWKGNSSTLRFFLLLQLCDSRVSYCQ